jgi:hypothetical protein
MPLGFERAVFAAVSVSFMLGAAPSLADGAAEPTYGRMDGDVSLVVGAGAMVVPGAPRVEGEVRIRYLDTVGVFAAYEDGPRVASDLDPTRALSTGLELRPVFLARWLNGLETERARLDMVLDSIGLDLGAIFFQPRGGGFASRSGLLVGLGVEIPIFANASGPWIDLHGGTRWSEDAVALGVVRGAVDRSAFLAITLSWHQFVSTHLVDVGDEAPQ